MGSEQSILTEPWLPPGHQYQKCLWPSSQARQNNSSAVRFNPADVSKMKFFLAGWIWLPILWWTLSDLRICSAQATAGFELPSVCYGVICKEKAGKKCGQVWKACFALDNADDSCHVKAILLFSIWILQMPLMWDSRLCVPSATWSSPGIQRQWPCLDCVTWLVGQLICDLQEPDCPLPYGTARLYCFFEVCHLQTCLISSLMETNWWSSPVQGSWAHRGSWVTTIFKHRPKLQAVRAAKHTVF